MKRIILLIVSIMLMAISNGCAATAIPGGSGTADILPAESTPPPVQPQNDKSGIDFTAQYIRTNGYAEGREYPIITVISSKAELDAYYEANKANYDLGRRAHLSETPAFGFSDVAESYTQEFFADKMLIMVAVEEPSGSISHEVTGITAKGGEMNITIARNVPEMGTADMAQWHIIIELDKAAYNGENVSVTFA